MQTSTLFLASLLVVFSFGCKNKKSLAEQTVEDQAVEQIDTGRDEVESTEMEPAPKTDGDTVYFAIERTACFGTCPTYRLTIYDDGSAVYEGIRFVEREGRFTGKVAPVTMQALVQLAESKGFFGMDDVYDKPVTDLPSVIIRVHADERDKQVVGRVGAPAAFRDMAAEVERMLADVEWTKVGDLR